MEAGFFPKMLPHRITLCLVFVGVFMLAVYTLLTGYIYHTPRVFQIVKSTTTIVSVRQLHAGKRRHLEVPNNRPDAMSSQHSTSALRTFGITLLSVTNHSSSRNDTPRKRHERAPFPSSKSGVRPKVILLWTSFYGYWDYIPRGRSLPHCDVSECMVTSDRKWLQHSDAVVFHSRNINIAKLPKNRFPHQKWVFFCMESPSYSYFSAFYFMRNMFNWTMTYRLDSDIVLSYGNVVRIEGKTPPSGEGDDRKMALERWHRKKMAVWMVSHCRTSSKRESYVKELQRYIRVDIVGACGEDSCPPDKTKECLKNFSQEYKFFLALENAICEDYVSEKFFRTLQFDIVPVVLGGANYSTIAPPSSYIDALSFKSPKHLASFLNSVAMNFTLYSSFLDWKKSYSVSLDTKKECALCRKIHSQEQQNPSTYGDFKQWWVDKSKCHSWRDNG